MYCDRGREGETYDMFQWEDTFCILKIVITALQKLWAYHFQPLHYIKGKKI